MEPNTADYATLAVVILCQTAMLLAFFAWLFGYIAG
jgi:hypothetical protein